MVFSTAILVSEASDDLKLHKPAGECENVPNLTLGSALINPDAMPKHLIYKMTASARYLFVPSQTEAPWSHTDSRLAEPIQGIIHLILIDLNSR
ncbi:hypothetical protein ACTXT7_007637 [Hymenolepis weldensis]